MLMVTRPVIDDVTKLSSDHAWATMEKVFILIIMHYPDTYLIHCLDASFNLGELKNMNNKMTNEKSTRQAVHEVETSYKHDYF